MRFTASAKLPNDLYVTFARTVSKAIDIVYRYQNKKHAIKTDCTCKMKVDTHKSVGVYFFVV